MKNTILFGICLLIQLAQGQTQPVAKKLPVHIKKHNFSFQDDYAWLEDMRSPEVVNWVDAQNAYTAAAFDNLDTRKIASKIKEYRSLSTNGLPQKKGRYFYSHYIIDKDKPAVLHYRKKVDDQLPIKLVDPYKLTNNDKAVIRGYEPSSSSQYLAYKLSTDGSDRYDIRFFNIEKSAHLPDIIKNVKSTNVEWKGEEGVFYAKNSNNSFFEQDSTHQLYYHKLGTPVNEDKLIFDCSARGGRVHFNVIRGVLFITEINKENTTETYYYADLKEPVIEPKFLLEETAGNFNFIGYSNGRLYFSTKKYEWGEVRSCSLLNIKDEKAVIPQLYTHLLLRTSILEDYIICQYRTKGKYYLSVYNIDGKFIRKFEAPYGMDFNVKFFNKETNDLYVTLESYVIPPVNYKLNLINGEFNPYFNAYLRPKPTLFPLDYFETKTITYKSRDNEDVPLTIIHKKNMVLDGNSPALLRAYGGFGVVEQPNYDVGLLYFLEKGGVFAFAEVRGGGEKGLKWYEAGKGMNKKNSINDLVDAAEFLVNNKYTNPAKLAINGGSHGGLVVSGAMIQRPDLFKVVISNVGRLDLYTLKNYTIGKYNQKEYGDIEKENEFNYLMSYSPYHTIKDDVNYPISLIVTGENDDRVPPFNSYKFAARLQNRDAQKNPVYLQVYKTAGHNGNTATFNDYLEQAAQFYAFLIHYLQ